MTFAGSRAYKASAETHYNKAQLKVRGWTDRLIEDFLGEPDVLSENPHYASAAPVRFFEKRRVHRKEGSVKFRQVKEKSEQRKVAAKKAVETKTQQTESLVKSLIESITVKELDMPALLQATIESYNAHHRFSGQDKHVCADAKWQDGDEFLARICVNYLRHHCTPYHDLLEKLKGRVGTRDAYWAVKDEILFQISLMYPELSDECSRQQNRMNDMTL